MSVQILKEERRELVRLQSSFSLPKGKIAEVLRRDEAYRKAEVVFVVPSEPLDQIRINALLDGKDLIMPGPGLKQGFFICRPHSIPFRDMAFAVSFRGMQKFAERLDVSSLSTLQLDLMLTGAVAIDRDGMRLGDGLGFFDLTCAILAAYGAFTDRTRIYGVVEESQLTEDALPHAPWDMRMDGAVTSDGVRSFEKSAASLPAIFWDELPERRIRKIDPLWKLKVRNEK